MAGLELLFSSASSSISSPQDALVCFVHWEILRRGYKCLGVGDEPQSGERKSELLPAGWNESQELYTMRYSLDDDTSKFLLKAFTVDSTLIFNVMDQRTEKVCDLSVKVSDYIDEDNLWTFESVFRNTEQLKDKLKFLLLPSEGGEAERPKEGSREAERVSEDPPLIPTRAPPIHPPNWSDPMAPFAAGGADLDPFGGRTGGMIVDPLHSGFPRAGFDPSAGVPGILPPHAVPPGARFDPFGPVGRHRPGPDHDHMPPPGHDNMFM